MLLILTIQIAALANCDLEDLGLGVDEADTTIKDYVQFGFSEKLETSPGEFEFVDIACDTKPVPVGEHAQFSFVTRETDLEVCLSLRLDLDSACSQCDKSSPGEKCNKALEYFEGFTDESCPSDNYRWGVANRDSIEKEYGDSYELCTGKTWTPVGVCGDYLDHLEKLETLTQDVIAETTAP